MFLPTHPQWRGCGTSGDFGREAQGNRRYLAQTHQNSQLLRLNDSWNGIFFSGTFLDFRDVTGSLQLHGRLLLFFSILWMDAWQINANSGFFLVYFFGAAFVKSRAVTCSWFLKHCRGQYMGYIWIHETYETWDMYSNWVYCLQSRWWFQIFFIFIPTWGRFPFWLIFSLKDNTSCGDSTTQPYLSIRPRLPAQTYLPLVRCSMPKVRWLIKMFQEVDIEIPLLKLVENSCLFQALKGGNCWCPWGSFPHFWGSMHLRSSPWWMISMWQIFSQKNCGLVVNFPSKWQVFF